LSARLSSREDRQLDHYQSFLWTMMVSSG
jgi:hypothetical protein